MRQLTTLLFCSLLLMNCGGGSESQNGEQTSTPQSMVNQEASNDDPMSNKGIGPISSISLGQVDQAMADEGETIFSEMCTACHKPTEKFIGPAPIGITSRRSPEWIMNMILNPEQMVREDPIAKQLLIEYNMAPMANQGLSEDQARKILEYFRTLE